MATAIMKKMSMKALVGDVKGLLKVGVTVNEKGEPNPMAEGETKWIGRIFGMAKGLKTGESNFGPWTAVLGDFQVEGYEGNGKGKTFRTGQLFLPEVVENMVVPEVANLEKGASVLFAFDIGIIANEESAPGYVYTASFVKEPAENDPLSLFAKEVAALPAPTSAPVEAPKEETKEPAKK